MSERQSRPSSPYLELPSKSVEVEDSGAQDSAASSDDEHFSDAIEGQDPDSRSPSRTSPIPRTRVEKVDEDPAHGDVPGTRAYSQREQDAVPDEIEVIPEGSRSRSSSNVGSHDHSGESPIPRTQVEKVDPSEPAHGEVPGTAAYEKHKADSVPDQVTTAPESQEQSPSLDAKPIESNAADAPVPETLLSRVDTMPSENGTSHPHAHQQSPSDALPDSTETVPDAADSPALLSTSPQNRDIEQPEALTENQDSQNDIHDETANDKPQDQAPMDDFDDFAEEQGEMGDDEFRDFDDFQDGEVADEPAINQNDVNPVPSPPVPPLLDLDTFQSLPDLFTAMDSSLDSLFPASKDLSSLPPVEPIPNSSAIFSTERSLSLWSQLVAPPPLQPQNWVKSRIRRLFLVSLGVPVDLDEILPASKQKKLVLPSMNLDGLETGTGALSRSQSLRKDGTDSPTTSGASRSRTSRRREPSPPPELDLAAVRRLCATTDAALDGFTDPEIKGHVSELEKVTHRASNLLEYWLKRRDRLVSEKEAFEGVIENLVSHARRTRK